MTDTLAPAWGANYDRMGPAVRARCMADDREFRQAQQAQERERAERAAYDDEQRLRAAVEAAELRGEYVSMSEVARTGGACVGRTRGEFVAYVSAMQDVEDAREARRRAVVEPTAEELQHRQAMMLTANPTAGRTKAEALAYFSAVQDLEDLAQRRAAALGVPTPSEEAAEQALLEKRQEQITARSRKQNLITVARAVAQGEVRKSEQRQLEQRYADGEILEGDYYETARRFSA